MPQVTALAGEAVLRARRTILIRHPAENAVVDQVVEPPGQDVARDPETGLEVIETGHADEGVPDDEQAPPLTDSFQALRDGAGQVLKTRSLHASTVIGCVIERTSLPYRPAALDSTSYRH